MSERLNNHKENIYGLATANVLDAATLHFAFGWGLLEHTVTADASGYDGVEAWPTNPRISRQIRTSSVEDVIKPHILSAHQSPRTERACDILRTPGAVAPILLLPELTRSLSDLEQIQTLAGHDIPVVMYKETPASFHTQTHLRKRLIQPDPEVADAWNVTSAEDFVEKLHVRGFTGACLDTTHARRRHKSQESTSPFIDWKTLIPTLIRNNALSEVHLAIGRTDPNITDLIGREQSIDELADFMHGTLQSEPARMLSLIAEMGWRGQVTVEVLPSAIREVTGVNNRFLSRVQLINAYTAIRESLYQVFDK